MNRKVKRANGRKKERPKGYYFSGHQEVKQCYKHAVGS